jgi:hypothetical protein
LLHIFVQVINTHCRKSKMEKSNTGNTVRNQMAIIRNEAVRPKLVGLIVIAGLLFLLFQGCAKVGNPTGGPKDVQPPKYLEGIPENRSLNFTGDKIDITFDEYIQLKDENSEVLISPPMKEKPVIRVREKSLRVTFNNELRPQTTYTLNFGKSLSDLNESNLLPDFEFVFSTGSIIDSLSVTGKVVDAFNHKPESKERMVVMLYENLSDSAPLVEIPRYYGRANKDGLYSVNNIHPDTFRIIALQDENNNLHYDQGIEAIGFLDSLLIITAENVVKQTFIKDTVKIITPAGKPGRRSKQDTIQYKADTIIAPGKLLNALNVSFYTFLEESDKVFITSRKRDVPENLTFIFSRPLFDTLQVTPLNFKPGKDWFIRETSHNNDTLSYWITDSLIAKMDTLVLKLTYLTTDSASRFMAYTDTVKMRYQAVVARGAAGRRNENKEKVKEKKVLSLSGSIKSRNTLNLNKPIVFSADKPLQIVNPDSIELYSIVDSLYIKQQFTCLRDSFSLRQFRLASKWEEVSQYRLLLKPGAAYDIYGVTNDSLDIFFATQSEDYYGKILLTIEGDRYPVIVQVLDERGNVAASKQIEKPGLNVFSYLSPGKYSLKAIYDKNQNKKWDTGNYLKHIQPEPIFLYALPKALRSNWDVEISWIITD